MAVLVSQGASQSSTPPTFTPTPPTTPAGAVGSGHVTLGALPSGSHVLQGGDGTVFLYISLNGEDLQGLTPRVPLNVGLVIDRSGSLAGPKLADAKAAARQLISNLHDGDQLSIVAYGSDVTLLAPATQINTDTRLSLAAAVENITDRGGTFLSGGFERARDELLRASSTKALNRVILISDGQANEGVTATSQLSRMARQALADGVHLTTIGVGLDFNENLMTAMAEHGGGHYYFIEDSSSMASIFSRELKTLVNTIARESTVTFRLAEGVRLLDLYGYTYEQQGDAITVHIPDIYAGQQRKIICRLQVPAGRVGAVDLGVVALRYTDVITGASAQVQTQAQVRVTDDSAQVTSGQNAEVLAKAEEAKISRTLKVAMEKYAHGDVAAAQQDLRQQIDATRKANSQLKSFKLNDALQGLTGQLSETQAAEPSSPRGRALVKGGKYDGYLLGH